MRFLILVVALLSAPLYAETKIIRQVMDMNVENIDKMYQFIPDYVEIQPGDTVKITGSLGAHTAHSIPGMLPEGAEAIGVANASVSDIKFTVPGVYGIKCKVHHRHGMVALIVVGDPSSNIVEARAAAKKRVSRRAQDKMQKLLDRAEALVP